jgi:hypothetical protein
VDWKYKMATTIGHKFNIDPCRKNVSVVFFSETTEPFKNKLDWHAS